MRLLKKRDAKDTHFICIFLKQTLSGSREPLSDQSDVAWIHAHDSCTQDEIVF